MDKSGWNWKTHLLSFVLGFLTGRYTKRLRESAISSSEPSINTQHGVSGSRSAFAALEARFVQFDKNHPNIDDIMTSTIFLMTSVIIRGVKELGYEFDMNDPQSAVTDELITKSIYDAARMTGRMPTGKDLQERKRLHRIFVTKLISFCLSAAPPIPSFVTEEEFEAVDIMARLFGILAREKNSSIVDDNLPDFESLLTRWTDEARPTAHTRTLFLLTNGIRSGYTQ